MINIGDKFVLEPLNESIITKYKCQLVDILDDAICIDYPVNIQTKKSVFLLNGAQLKVTFVTDEGIAYMFHTEIIGRKKENHIPMIILTRPLENQYIKIQRREYVRIETTVDVAVHPIDKEFSPFTTITFDISAGGAAIIVPKSISLPIHTNLLAYFVLALQNGEYSYVDAEAKVMRILPYNEGNDKISIEFNELTPFKRQLLIRYCFDRELALKKKGLIS